MTICTTTLVAGIINISPPTSNTSNSTWDLLAAKGDPGAPPVVFNQSATHSSGANLNMRTLADSLGYDGVSDATFTVTVSSSITSSAGSAVSSGSWPSGIALNLTLIVNSGVVLQGAGGAGGRGGGAFSSGFAGGAGGAGVYMLAALSITNNGTISGGSGGGGGGGGYFNAISGAENNGGGGGGGWPNGAGGGLGPSNGGFAGGGGTTAGGGAGGNGGTNAGKGGGKTGITPINGSNGQGSTRSGGSGGVKGDGIKQNGHTLSLTNNGSHSGLGA